MPPRAGTSVYIPRFEAIDVYPEVIKLVRFFIYKFNKIFIVITFDVNPKNIKFVFQ